MRFFTGLFTKAFVALEFIEALEFMETTETVLSVAFYLPFFFNWVIGFPTGTTGTRGATATREDNDSFSLFYYLIGSL